MHVRWLYDGCAVQLALTPVQSGAELKEVHSQMLEQLLSGKCGDLVSATKVLNDIFVCAMILLEQPHLMADHFIKALQLLMFRTKLHSRLSVFYHCHEDLIL